MPRDLQGDGRFDSPDNFGALYVSRSAESAVAERIQAFRGRVLRSSHLRTPDGRVEALVAIDDEGIGEIVDLDDPGELIGRALRPSMVATRYRPTTQELSISIFREGRVGFQWWSTLEASWPNVTLFAERAIPQLAVASAPEPLTLDHPVVGTAAEFLGIALTDSSDGPKTSA